MKKKYITIRVVIYGRHDRHFVVVVVVADEKKKEKRNILKLKKKEIKNCVSIKILIDSRIEMMM